MMYLVTQHEPCWYATVWRVEAKTAEEAIERVMDGEDIEPLHGPTFEAGIEFVSSDWEARIDGPDEGGNE